MLRVLIIGSGSPIPTFVQRRLQALSEQGLNLVVALEYGQSHELHSAIEVVRYGDVRKGILSDIFYYLGKLMSRPNMFFQVWKLNGMLNWLTGLKIAIKYFPLAVVPRVSVVHIQWLNLITSLGWLREIYNVPVIASVRGSQVTVYPRTRIGFAELTQKAIALADVLHLVSKDLIPACVALGGRPEKLFVNYNGINLETFRPPISRESAQMLRLISVGAVIWRKGYLFQLEIIKHLMVLTPVSLNIIGDGPDLEGLKYMAFKLGVHEVVHFNGRASEEEVGVLLQNADVYISTSAAEGLANSCMEAAACGLPVVTFACEGMNEVVEHGVSGYVVAPGEIDQMVAYLLALKDVDLRNAMGHRARQRMERDFDQNKCVTEMIKHYYCITNAS